MIDKKRQLIEALRHFADTIDKDSVKVRESNLEMIAGYVSGVDPENFSFETHHRDGIMSVDLSFEIYDKENDKSHEAYDPMAEIRKEAGY